MTERFQDWPSRLHGATEAARRAPFAWGGHDCALFAASLIEAMTGVDPAAEWRGAYDDEAGAVRVLMEIASGGPLTPALSPGGGEGGLLLGAARALAGAQGWAEIEPARAQRGDLVLIEAPASPLGAALGICLGGHAVCPAEHGVVLVTMARAVATWRV